MLNKSLRWAAGLVLAAGLASGAWAQAPIKIGFHAGLTGPAAADGNAALAAARVAIEQANAQGGIAGRKLALVVEDDQGKPEHAAQVANRLIGEGVRAVISAAYSAPARAAAPVFQKAQLPYVVAVSSAPEITRGGNYMFRVTSVGEVQGRAAAKAMSELLHKKRVVLLTVKTDFGKALVAGFKEAAPRFGLEIVKEYEYAPTDRQFGPLIASIKADNPQAIYATGFYFTGGPLVSQLRSAGVTADIMGAESLSPQQFIDIAGPAAEGTVITNVIDWGSQDPAIVDFLGRYKAATGTPAAAVAATTHAATTVLLAALRNAKSDEPARIRAALETTEVMTVMGRVSFNKLREVKKNFPLSIVRNGKWQRFGVIDDADLLAPPEQ